MRNARVVLLLFIAVVTAALPALRAAGDTRATYDYSEVDKLPVIKKAVRISYPWSVKRLPDRQEVVLRFLVKTDGTPTQFTVLKFSNPDMINAVLTGYEDARFSPGMKDGKPVDTWMEVTETYSKK